MNIHGSKGWGSLAFAALALPLLMGAKGGCGEDISMGSDLAGASGADGHETGGKANSGGAGGANARGGAPSQGGVAQGGANARAGAPSQGGAIARAGAPSQGGVAQGGANARAGAPSQGGVAQGGAIGRGGANSCDGFENSTSRDEVTVRYVNDGTEPIYVGRTEPNECGTDPHEFLLAKATDEADAADEPLTWGNGICTTCAALQRGPIMCPTSCEPHQLVRIDPGGSYDFSWTGTYYQAVDMPLECYSAEGSPGQPCSKVVAAEAAVYRFVGTAWSSLECPLDLACHCSPEASGACRFPPFDGRATGTARRVAAALDYPAEKLVELHFD
jgi:hypothetical protein